MKNLIKDFIYNEYNTIEYIDGFNKDYSKVINIFETIIGKPNFEYRVRKEIEFTELGEDIINYILVVEIKHTDYNDMIKVCESINEITKEFVWTTGNFIFVIDDDNILNKLKEEKSNYYFNFYTKDTYPNNNPWGDCQEFNYNKEALTKLIDIGYVDLIIKINSLCRPERN